MRKTLFSFLTISVLFSSCITESDDVSSELENLAYRGGNSTDEDPLCLPPTPPQPINFGNPSDYPTLSSSSYYSLTNPNNGQVWFFNAVKSAYRNRYFTVKDQLTMRFNVGNHDYPIDSGKPFRYDYQSYHQIYASDGMFYELYPNSTISQAAGSYALYKILSSIDEVINNNSSMALKPTAITFDYDVTMCGGYSSLYYHVYYRNSN